MTTANETVIDQISPLLLDETLPCGMLMADVYPLYRILHANRILLNMLGYAEQKDMVEALEGSALKFVHPDDLERICAEGTGRGNDTAPYEISYRMLRKDGSFIWITQRSRHIKRANGQEIIIAFYTDITPLMEKREALNRIVNTIPAGIAVFQQKGTVRTLVSMNDALRAILEAQPGSDDRQEDVFFQRIHPDDGALVEKMFHELFSEQRHATVTYRSRDEKNDRYLWLHASGAATFQSDGSQIGYLSFTDITSQKEIQNAAEASKKEIENLIDSIPGGIARYKFTPNGLKALYCSYGFSKLLGQSPEEYIEHFNINWESNIYRSDLPILRNAVKICMEHDGIINLVYRLLDKNGQVIWVNLQARKVATEDGCAIFHCVFHNLSATEELYQNILNGSNSIIQVSDYTTKELLFVNKSAAQFAGRQIEDYLGKTCYEYMMHVEKPCTFCNLSGLDAKGFRKQIFLDGRHFTVHARRLNWNGHDAFIEYVSDITEIVHAQDELREQSEEMAALIGAVPGGIFKYAADESERFAFVSANMLRLLGHTADSFAEAYGNRFSNMICEEDRTRVLQELGQQLDPAASEGLVACEYRIRMKNGRAKWVYDTEHLITDEHGVRWCYAVIVDIDERKKLELALRMEQEKIAVALKNANLLMWEYDVRSKRVVRQSLGKFYARPLPQENVPQSLVRAGIIHHDSIPAYLKLYQQITDGAASAQADIRMIGENGETFWFQHCLKTVFDKDGTPVQAIGCGVDITKAKEMERRYQNEVEYINAAQDTDLLVKVRCDLTQCVVESYTARDDVGISHDGMDYDVGVEALARTGASPEHQQKIRDMLNRERVLSAFAIGDTAYSLDYLRKTHDGKGIWANTSVRSYQDPETSHIKSFMYTHDINEKMLTKIAFQGVMYLHYDFVGIINTITRSFFCLSQSEGKRLPGKYKANYDDVIKSSTEGLRDFFYTEEDYRIAHEDLILERLMKTLESRKDCSFNIKSWNKERTTLLTFHVGFCYVDAERTQILMCASDITDTVAEEQRRQDLLRSALQQAEQANHAKSDFLSHMSHEIRTPMNAIIGMTALAAQNINHPDQVADCISKVGLSARYLLSLINDILDMSRIESGKLTLKNDKIQLDTFVNGVNAICYEQAVEKSVDYDAIVTGFTEETYMGDAMKLQQILLNLLSNAVKFTPKGGKVQLVASQERIEGDKAVVKFIVNDTGIGISEAFQKVMFEPFEQEYAGTTTPYAGTGLGLAITKNLVKLMGGKIAVVSILGVGTEFTVTLPLGICKDTQAAYKISPKIHLKKLSALVVDDEVLICRQAQELLHDMGMKAEWVDSGVKAVALVREKWAKQKCFDLILVDWKMPDMDGIETARRIREIVGPDVTIIIITAYEWADIEQDARAAGVNLLLSKPLFRRSLLSAFEKIYDEKKPEKVDRAIPLYDFSGKRVLLVEDHLLNVEVARRLLESKGMAVEVAGNGLEAIELFASSPAEHFDAILMDIRMPVMDGLTATKSIRQMKKQTAKTIPILAMSANAFDEDVEKSISAGMNAHLAKPIEPQRLYAALLRVWSKTED